MKKIYLRTLISVGLGAILGIFCILGVSQRIPAEILTTTALYLLAAWYNRLIMGIIIGFAGEFHFLGEKYRIVESIIRGISIGAIVSVSFSFLIQPPTWTYFFAGIVYGLVIDLVSTLIVEKVSKKE